MLFALRLSRRHGATSQKPSSIAVYFNASLLYRNLFGRIQENHDTTLHQDNQSPSLDVTYGPHKYHTQVQSECLWIKLNGTNHTH